MEEFESTTKVDAKDKESVWRKLEQCIDTLVSSDYPESVINIVTGAITMKSVYVDSAVERGKEQMDEYERNWPANFHHPLKRKVVTLVANKKHIAVNTTKVYDTNLIVNRVIGFQASTREVNNDNVLKHEIARSST